MTAPTRARVVIVSPRGRVVLIRRERAGERYWSFPGGGVRDGETPREAARREVHEELGLQVMPGRRLVRTSKQALFLARVSDEPQLRMRGHEIRRDGRRAYRPQWVPLRELPDLDVRPRSAGPLFRALARGSSRRRAA